MSFCNSLIFNPIYASLKKESNDDDADMGLFRNQSSRKGNAEVTGPLLQNVQPRKPILLSQCFDSILSFRQIETDGIGALNLISLPANQDHSHSECRDSQAGIKNSCRAQPSGGETVSKIRSEFNITCGPWMALVHVLRENNDANLLAHHKNKNYSHKTTNSEEESNQNMASTMTARPLPTEYLPQRRLKYTNVSRSSKTRIRSRSIAIKRPTSEEQLEEIRQNSLAAEYDYATWRMYNRIIEYRQKHPLPYVHENDTSSLDATSSAPINMDGSDSTSDCTAIDDDDDNQWLQEENLQQYYPEYGEVFDLDL